jgi:hypothetical protein
MGKEKLIDKTIQPLSAGGINVAQATGRPARELGVLPVGYYKGQAAFVDLDKLVNQPLAAIERLYSTDRIDARDIIEAVIAAGAAVGASARARLTVPAGEVWFLNRIVPVSPAESGGAVGDIVQVNFRISKWPYPDVRGGSTVDDDGRSYWPAAQGTAAEDTYTVDLPAQGELGEELRLEGGDVITLVATLTGVNAGADLTASLTPFGRKVKKLVE